MIMGDREYRARETVQPPQGLERLAKEVEAVVWLQAQISLLDRIKPSKRNDALKSDLVLALEGEVTQIDWKLIANQLQQQVKTLESESATVRKEINPLLNSRRSKEMLPDEGLTTQIRELQYSLFWMRILAALMVLISIGLIIKLIFR